MPLCLAFLKKDLSREGQGSKSLTHLYFSLVWDGISLLEYCLDSAERSPSPFPLPPLAGSKVGLAAVVISLITGKAFKHYTPVFSPSQKAAMLAWPPGTLRQAKFYHKIAVCNFDEIHYLKGAYSAHHQQATQVKKRSRCKIKSSKRTSSSVWINSFTFSHQSTTSRSSRYV